MTAISPDPHPFKRAGRYFHTVVILFLFGRFSSSYPILCPAFSTSVSLSYVNEMEDCGVTYYEDQVSEDPYTIFQQHGCNLVRLRLWHTPSWYDELNEGTAMGELDDVKVVVERSPWNGSSTQFSPFQTGGRTPATSWRLRPGCR